MSQSAFAIGVDYGTSSCRALVVDVRTGDEFSISEFAYPHGQDGVITDPAEPLLARQHPGDYIAAFETAVREAVDAAASHPGFSAHRSS